MRQKDELIMEEIYSEGILDRMRARRDGREAEKDVGLTMASKLRRVAQPTAKKMGFDVSRKEKEKWDKADVEKATATARSLATTYMPRFQKIANNFANDLKKVNIDISMIEDDGIRTVLSSILNYKSE